MPVCAIIGGCYGSEGKGLIAGVLAADHQTHVRVGAANAGHTVYVNGERHVMRQLPCAAYANPDALLVLGAGALISPEVLKAEIGLNEAWRRSRDLPALRLLVDRRAQVITDEHIAREAASGLAERIGSCSAIAGEGIGEAQAARVLRDRSATPVAAHELSERLQLIDTVDLLHDVREQGILLEGTQGTGLSQPTGEFPFVTSRNVTAAGLAADCGLGPRDLDRVLLVCRTYPIRVANPPEGTSGPFAPGSRELDWEQVGVHGQPPERTTVTGLIRRVATMSLSQLQESCRLNSATEIALTFCDYVQPDCRNVSEWFGSRQFYERWPLLGTMIEAIEQRTRVPVTMLGTGPDTICRSDSPHLPQNITASKVTALRLRLRLASAGELAPYRQGTAARAIACGLLSL